MGEQIRELKQLGYSMEEICRILNFTSSPEDPRFVLANLGGEFYIGDTKPPSQAG